MDNKEETYKQIAGTLDYGLLCSKAFIIFMWALIGFGCLCLIVFAVATFVAEEPLLVLAVTLCPLFFCSIGGYFLIRESRHCAVIKLWCEDAVEHVAYTEKVLCMSPEWSYILKVKVNYKNEKYVYFSNSQEKSPFDSFFLKGRIYHGKMVAKYGDGKVKILYSPKYEKIMFLKSEQPKTDETAEIE